MMDVLDEKLNVPAVMELDEPVSVRDRESFRFTQSKLSIVDDDVCLSHFCKDENFAAKNMPDLGHEVKDFKVFTWRLHGWRKLEKKITSPEFECGGHRWYASALFMFP